MVRAAGMRCGAHVGVGERALDARSLAAIGRALHEQPVLELGGEPHHQIDGDPLADFLRGLPRDLLARASAVEPRDDGHEVDGQDGVGPGDALGVAQHQRAAEATIRDDDGLDGTETRSRCSRGHASRIHACAGLRARFALVDPEA